MIYYNLFFTEIGILSLKLFWPNVRKNCSNDREKLLNVEITSTIYLNSERVRTIFETDCFFNLFSEVSQIKYIRTIRIQIGRNNWDLETCMKI